MRGLFITGTDTGCGKTEITLALMWLLQRRGYRVLGMKPAASGYFGTAHHNADALSIQDAGSVDVPYELINPYVFALPIAPHIAAAEAGREIRPEVIRTCFQALSELADLVIVEGVGGWRVPLGPGLEVADLSDLLGIPVLLTVGVRLGCLNHALLTAHDILERGCFLAGWVANCVDPAMLRPNENIAALAERIPVPCLGRVPHLPEQPDAAAIGKILDGQELGKFLNPVP